jgi:hypothetical protein
VGQPKVAEDEKKEKKLDLHENLKINRGRKR